MLLNQLRYIQPYIKLGLANSQKRYSEKVMTKCVKEMNMLEHEQEEKSGPVAVTMTNKDSIITREVLPAARVVPFVLSNKEPVVLPFDDVPGPKSLKYISTCRKYISDFGTQLTAGALTLGLNIGTYLNTKKPLKNLSALFDEYGPVVRFVSPVGNDIVLINHPDHIQKVYTMEGDYPARSTLDSLEKYRSEHRNHTYGLYTVQGQAWSRQRSVVVAPLDQSVAHHLIGIDDVCKTFTQKIYNCRNYQDELAKDLYKELHKWSFDCMGLILFSKKFTMLETDLVYSQCDMSWLYHSLEKATEAIIKCESGLHLWKLFPTPTWASLVKYCDSLDGLIGKHVLEAEQSIALKRDSRDMMTELCKSSLIHSMLMCQEKMRAEDIATIIMDMLLIGVNTITSSMSFLLYYLAKFQRSQKILYKEVRDIETNLNISNIKQLTAHTPYLQACIKETLRLVPPIPVLTRILPKNITLDRYNIPRGTVIIMSTQDASLKEGNYNDATVFTPERWLKDDAKEYHAFASIPFGSGTRKCLGQNIAETMLSLLAIRIVQKYKLEYHYGDIHSTRNFISRPNKALKIRFVDRP
ncbi:putative cytochrome P450 301a1, mitochondrial isoform X2 [Anticarsia gemmatalis]|uniref:putative cytochrome P450 301a1, mitochondrial isoform X2 n=1 Tax=Anticarsia gemmatalis TaxID=129554 RepID=UPI003F75BDC7